MKKLISIMLFGFALALSCTKENIPTTINEIDGLYTAPAGATTVQLAGARSEWAGDRRYFKLDFGALSTTLVGYDALLGSGQYVLGADQIGSAIDTKVNGQNAREGFVTVNEKGGQYQITATVDGQVYFWTGALPFQADPAPLDLTVLQQAQANKDSKLVTLQLATDGISQEFDASTWQTVWKGEGKYLALDLYSEDGYLHDGTYTASAEGGVVNPGEFGRGWDPGDLYNVGMVFTDWGTCLWTVSGGVATAEKITDGMVKVTSREEKVEDKDVTVWTISWGAEYPVEVVFEGAIPALTKPKKPSGPVAFDYTYTIGDPMDCSTQGGEVVSGVKKYPFTFTNANGEEVAYLEFILAEGAGDVEPGDYVSTEYAHEAGQLANGYFMDFGDWGTFSGGSWYVNGAGEKVFIDPGVTVSVAAAGTGAFKFSSDGFELAAAGPNYVPGGDVTTDHQYKIGELMQCSTQAGEVVSGVMKYPFTITDAAGQEVAYLEFILAEGSADVESGDYVSTEYAHEAGQLANGYFMDFGDWGSFAGGSWYLNGAGEKVYIDPGLTVTVTQLGPGAFTFAGDGFEFSASRAD